MLAPVPTYDVMGVGFGPSNISLAIAMDELAASGGPQWSRCFVEKQKQFAWHGHMLLPGTDMQIAFLKDLVSLRNPTSVYSFVNYLRQSNRLEAFIDQKTLFPSRIEFNDYLRWVAGHFSADCRYGETVSQVTPEYERGDVVALQVHSHDAHGREHMRRCRSLVIAPGGAPYIPAPFHALSDSRVFHTGRYLEQLQVQGWSQCPPDRVAVVGGGQSAAEVFLDLSQRYPHAQIDLIFRGNALKPAEDAPSINHIFAPDYVNFFHAQPAAVRANLLAEFRNTNYAVVDRDLIERISAMQYAQRVSGIDQCRVLPGCAVQAVHGASDGVYLDLQTLAGGHGQPSVSAASSGPYQAVVLATGYQRDASQSLLASLPEAVRGSWQVGRDYRLQLPAHVRAPIFAQGFSESTHGLSDTLLSVMAVRAGEIARSLASLLSTTATRRTQADEEVAL